MRRATGLARELPTDPFHECIVGAHSHGRIEIDELHAWISYEAIDPPLEVVACQGQPFPLNELNDLAALEIYGRYEHATAAPEFRCCAGSLSTAARLIPRSERSRQLMPRRHALP